MEEKDTDWYRIARSLKGDVWRSVVLGLWSLVFSMKAVRSLVELVRQHSKQIQ